MNTPLEVKPKFKVGDIIWWKSYGITVAEIIEINHLVYSYKFIINMDFPSNVGLMGSYPYEMMDKMAKVASPSLIAKFKLETL